jgi:tocopherol cyclase
MFLVNGLTFLSQNNSSLVKFVDYPKVKAYKANKSKNSSMFQGNKKTKKYFEGWYFKMVSQDEGSILSVIPGISISEDGSTKHAFIQIIDGKIAETKYINFPIEDFYFSKEDFLIKIGNNVFSKDSIVLDIQRDSLSIIGKVYMKNLAELKSKNKQRQKIMGWYYKVPFMECYHGVVSLNHDLYGEIKTNNRSFRFDGGRGYIEKDWGKSMPSSWIWIQTNSFKNSNSSFMLSIAKIPWLGFSFTGFLGFYYINNEMVRFGTYSRAKVKLEKQEKNNLNLNIFLKDKVLEIQTLKNSSGMLKAPVNGNMNRRISEGIDAELTLKIIDKNKKMLFIDRSITTGLEVVGNIDELFKN